MNKLGFYFLSFVMYLSVVSRSEAQPKTVWADKQNSFVEYTMKHTLHEFSGTDKNVNTVIAYDQASNVVQKVSVSLNVSDFNSGNGNRDSHAMEVLESIKYPKIKFACNKVEKSGNKLTLTGLLTFHGVTKEKKIEATQENKSDKLIVKGNFKVSLDEYKVERPSFMMVPVEDDIDIKFETQFATPRSSSLQN